ncbi:MAG: CCA tRNA nucleotidyltransferase [Dehalococcoidales bacterium]|nr:CCA tRNA nucleotidyltransferase [Dehalococcoidales bacterium]
MTPITNLTDLINQRLPAELAGFMKSAGNMAANGGEKLYLVGGLVRDLLLGEANLDVDLVVEGDAVTLARRLSTGNITIHHRFNTAKLQWRKWTVDLTSARSEIYPRPGALPSVKPGKLADDLFRRDFTINAMAVALVPQSYGQLIDLYGGLYDLERRFVRILHPISFTDDASRIWRAVRYEQRLDFQIELETLRLLQRDIPMLDNISGDRVRYELECICNEQLPEKAFKRAGELGVLAKLHPSLSGNGWLADMFDQARRISLSGQKLADLYLALLAYRLPDIDREQLVSCLRLPRALARILRDAGSIRARLGELANTKLRPSQIYHLLHGYSSEAVTANLLAGDLPPARRNIQLYLEELRSVKPVLAGHDLIDMGVTPGPGIGEALKLILDARLDGTVKTRRDEERLVGEWLATN